MFSEGMTLFFLDHHNTTDALPYPRVLRLDGEAAPTGIQLRPGSAHRQALEQALNHALQHPAAGAHAQAQETTFQLRPAHDKDPAGASIAPNSHIPNESQTPGAPPSASCTFCADPTRAQPSPSAAPHQPRQGGTTCPWRRTAAPHSPARPLPQAGARQLLRR